MLVCMLILLYKALDGINLQLPPPATVNGMAEKLPFHIIEDDTFPLSTELMKSYPQRQLDKPKRIFNYRFSCARRTVENAFGILANRFRVFLTNSALPWKSCISDISIVLFT